VCRQRTCGAKTGVSGDVGKWTSEPEKTSIAWSELTTAGAGAIVLGQVRDLPNKKGRSARQRGQGRGRSFTQLAVQSARAIQARDVGETANGLVVDEHLRNSGLARSFFEPVPKIWPIVGIDLVKSHAFAAQQGFGAMTIGAPRSRVDGNDGRHAPMIRMEDEAGKGARERYVSQAGSRRLLVAAPRPTSNDFGPTKISSVPSTTMDLRDKFAVHIAASLAGALSDPAQIARRSYEFAEALIAERARRIDADEARAIADVLPFGAIEPELNPDELDPEWLEEPYDPTWDVEPRWTAEAAPEAAKAQTVEKETTETEASEVVKPGLARTQPADVEAQRAGGGQGA